MVQRGEDSGFSLKPGETFGAIGEEVGKAWPPESLGGYRISADKMLRHPHYVGRGPNRG